MTGLLIGHIYITEQSRKAPEVALALFWTSKLDILHLKKKTKNAARESNVCSLVLFFRHVRITAHNPQPQRCHRERPAAVQVPENRASGVRPIALLTFIQILKRVLVVSQSSPKVQFSAPQ